MFKNCRVTDDFCGMRRSMLLASLTVAVATAAGACSEGSPSRATEAPIDRPAGIAVTTVAGPTTTFLKLGGDPTAQAVSAPVDPPEATSLPDDDGGTLCEAAAALDDPTADLKSISTVDELIPRAEDFRRQGEQLATLIDVAPPGLRANARAFAARFTKLADLLAKLGLEVAGGSSTAEETRTEVELTLGRLVIDAAGSPVPGDTGEVSFDNYFLAWIAPPCGPKELVTIAATSS